MSDNFKSTKFWGTQLVVLLGFILVWKGSLDAKVWLDMAVIAEGIYGGLNVAQKYVPEEKENVKS